MIKWNDLTPEQRDRLVAEKVMGWVDHICEDGTLHEVEGGWECGKCGLTGDWNNFDNHASHLELPPKYTQDMNAAIEVATSKNFTSFTLNGKLGESHAVVYLNHGGFMSAVGKTSQEAICKAVLRVCHIEVE